MLFGGARGGGKSDALLGDWVAHASRAKGWARGVIFRRTMPELEELIARSQELYPALGADWRAVKKTWTFPCGATLKMRWLDRDQDADRYQGHQYSYIGVDEVGTWPSPAPIDKLRATLRSAHGIQCVMRLTANPGGVGQNWITDRYIKPAAPATPFFDEDRQTWRVYIPSRLKDNRKLVDADPGYEARLRSSGPPWLVRAWLEGDWTASSSRPFFVEEAFLVDGLPAQPPTTCDYVFATMDTSAKTGRKRDGTGVSFWAFNEYTQPKLFLLDWDIQQMTGDLLLTWLPTIVDRLEKFSRQCGARYGSLGVQIEDASTGQVLIPYAQRQGWPVSGISSLLTSKGKTERAWLAGPYVYQGLVAICEAPFRKAIPYHDRSANHWLTQVTSFKPGQEDDPNAEDDLLDTACYGILTSLGPRINR